MVLGPLGLSISGSPFPYRPGIYPSKYTGIGPLTSLATRYTRPTPTGPKKPQPFGPQPRLVGPYPQALGLPPLPRVPPLSQPVASLLRSSHLRQLAHLVLGWAWSHSTTTQPPWLSFQLAGRRKPAGCFWPCVFGCWLQESYQPKATTLTCVLVLVMTLELIFDYPVIDTFPLVLNKCKCKATSI